MLADLLRTNRVCSWKSKLERTKELQYGGGVRGPGNDGSVGSSGQGPGSMGQVSRFSRRWALTVRILAFGTYDVTTHPRVSVLLTGLARRGHRVVELNRPLGIGTAGRVAALKTPRGAADVCWPVVFHAGLSSSAPCVSRRAAS